MSAADIMTMVNSDPDADRIHLMEQIEARMEPA